MHADAVAGLSLPGLHRKAKPVWSTRLQTLNIDADVSMRSYVMKTTSACFAVLHRLQSIHRLVLRTVFQSLVSYLVLPWLDYCNAVLAGIPFDLAWCLQSVMNAATQLVFTSSKCDHIMPLRRQLHWLKVSWKIGYKLAVLVYKCVHGLAQSYLADELHHLAESEF